MLGIKRVYRQISEDEVEVTVTPPKWASVGEGATVILTVDQFRRMKQWLNGDAMIQDCLGDLSNDEREILMTGIGPKKWDEIFKEDK
jgi:hypothetical protein